MKKTVLYCVVLLLVLSTGCTKEAISDNLSTSPAVPHFVQYVIPKGKHYATSNPYKAVEGTEMKFVVRFDSSCIYKTSLPENQWDINKLYGFADNEAHHHQFSARFGWRWSEGALRLFAYTYNSGERTAKEMAVIPIGKEVHCAIKISGSSYLFSVDEKIEAMPRQSKTAVAKGYQLYPYFGGDEPAPHDVRFWIKEEQ